MSATIFQFLGDFRLRTQTLPARLRPWSSSGFLDRRDPLLESLTFRYSITAHGRI